MFDLSIPVLPQDYKPVFISYLKNALMKCNHGEYYDNYFGSTKAKNYAFSVIMAKPRFNGDIIELQNSQVKMLFTADDREKTGFVFFSAFIQQKNKRFPLPDGNWITLRKINQLKEQEIMSNRVIFKTVVGGGLAVRQHDRETNKDRYFTVQDKEFISQMKTVLGVQAIGAGFPEGISSQIEIRPIQCKKVVVKQFRMYIDVTVGIFEMKADSRLLQYFYQAGLGSRHSQGLGLVEIISQG